MSIAKRMPGRNWRIDAFRVAAALLIVAIHTSPLMIFSETADFILTRVIARVAVPFFLMVTGYFVLPRCLMPGRLLEKAGLSRAGRTPGEYFRDYERKQLLLYGFSILLYLPVNWYAGNLKGSFRISRVVGELVFEGTFYHLWYLPGVILGLLLVYLAGRAFSYSGVLLLSFMLYLTGLGGDSYYGLVSQWEPAKAFYDWIFGVSPYTRNGVFFVPVFLWLGYGLARMGILREMRRRGEEGGVRNAAGPDAASLPGAYAGETGFCVSFILMLAEGIWLHGKGWQRHDSMYVFLPAVMGFLFFLLVGKTPGSREGKTRGSGGVGARRERAEGDFPGRLPGLSLPTWTTWMYLLHPIGIILVRGAAKAVKFMPLIENSLLHYAAVVLVSGCLAAGFCVAVPLGKALAARAFEGLGGFAEGAGNRGRRKGRIRARRKRRD